MPEKKIDVSDVFPDLDRPTVYANEASPFAVLHYFEEGDAQQPFVEKTIKMKTDRLLNMLEQIRRT